MLKNLTQYMLSNNMLTQYNVYNNSIIPKNVRNIVTLPTVSIQDKNTLNFIIPQYSDTLFWCFYISYMGIDMYNQIGKKSFQIEQELKINTLEVMRNEKCILKQAGLKQMDLDNELLNNKQINYKGLHALCINYKINIILIRNRMYYEIIGNVTNIDNMNIIKLEDEQYGIYLNEDNENYIEEYWKVLTFNKPLKCIGSYKVNELYIICNKLNIKTEYDTGRKKNKKYIYEEILTKIITI